ncbi:MAG: hypothetical protein R2798_04100 [Chitinophagales bacterium]|nr:hypothetical protein [Bacteroidota bacterium]
MQEIFSAKNLAILYKEHQVFGEIEKEPFENLQCQFGNMPADLCVLVCEENPLEEANLNLLKKIATVAKEVYPTFNIVYLPTNVFCSISEISPELRPKAVLVFGATPMQIGLNIDVPYYAGIALNGMQYIFSQKINELNKGALWQAMKQLFQLS